MRLAQSLLFAVSALVLSTGAAFAGDPYQSYERGGPELMSDAQSMDPLEREYTAQPQEYEIYGLYVIPSEVAVVPGVDSEGNPLNVIN